MAEDLNYWRNNAKEDYIKTPISVLRYITELEKKVSVGWIQTDGSVETLQYGRKSDKFAWEYVELGGKYKSIEGAEQDRENWDSEEFDLKNYTADKVKSVISGWGYELVTYNLDKGNIVIKQGDVYNNETSVQLICECLSEYYAV